MYQLDIKVLTRTVFKQFVALYLSIHAPSWDWTKSLSFSKRRLFHDINWL